MKPPRLRAAPHWLTLVAALALGIASYAAARSWLTAQARAAEARVTADLQPRRLLVAAVDLEAGTVLLPELLAARQVPARFASSAAVRAEQIARVEGQQLVHPVKSGEPILWPALSRGDDAAFSSQLQPGRRAITFAVDEINAFAGLLVPGDVIDLLYTSDEHGRPTVRTLLQQVTVLATGTTTQEDAGRPGEAPAATRTFATVTIGVTPDEATRIVLAQRAGELTALLRHPADAARIAERALDSRALTGGTPKSPARPSAATARDYVEFIVGRGARTREPVPPAEIATAAARGATAPVAGAHAAPANEADRRRAAEPAWLRRNDP